MTSVMDARYAIGGIALAASLFLLAGCSSTRVEGSWTRPEFAGTTIVGPVFVVGAMGDETSRRLYEDAMARKLEANKLRAIKSYDAIDGALAADTSESLVEAARTQGAAYLLSSAVIGHGKKTVVNSVPLSDIGVGTYRRSGPRHGYGAWYNRSWVSATTTVRTVDIYGIETVLVDVPSDRIEWTIRTKSAAGNSIAYDADDFSGAILKALEKSRLIPDGD